MKVFLSQPRIYFCVASLLFSMLLYIFTRVKYSTEKRNFYFRLVVIANFAASLIEILRSLCYFLPFGPGSTYFIPRFLQSVNFITSSLMTFTYILYLIHFVPERSRLLNAFMVFCTVAFSLYTVFCLINIRTGWIVTYDPLQNRYDLTRGPLYLWVGYMFPAVLIAFALIIFILDLYEQPKESRFVMILAISCSFGGMALQPALHGLVTITTFSAVVGLYLWYFAIENADFKKLKNVMLSLEKAKIEAQNANEAKSGFLASMSHEIRTPMNAVLGLDEMILNTEDMEKVHDYAVKMRSSGKALLAIINDILDYSKIESGKMSLVEMDYHLLSLVRELELFYGPVAKAQGLEFKLDVDQSLPECLYGDEFRIRQILRNLLDNGMKFTKLGSVGLKIGGEIKGDTLYLVISVIDTGIGIREEDLENLFISFERLEEPKNRSVGGTGLGLVIVKRLVEMMQGTITVESNFGEGSKFTARIPQRIVDRKTLAETRLEVQRSEGKTEDERYRTPNATVLVVDDNNVNLIVASGFLKRTGAKVVTCESGATCLELLKKQKFDIIFMDIMMPEMDGMETLRKSQNLGGNLNRFTPFIALTANMVPGLRDQYLELGFTDYVSKPIDSERLFDVYFRCIPQDLVQKDDGTQA